MWFLANIQKKLGEISGILLYMGHFARDKKMETFYAHDSFLEITKNETWYRNFPLIIFDRTFLDLQKCLLIFSVFFTVTKIWEDMIENGK